MGEEPLQAENFDWVPLDWEALLHADLHARLPSPDADGRPAGVTVQ